MKIFLTILLFLTLIGPITILVTGKINFNADWRTANRTSISLAPLPKDFQDAIIQVYTARAFNWRGVFAQHMWLAIKGKNAKAYKTYQVIGWFVYRKLPAIYAVFDVPDRRWFDQTPQIILDIRGEEAESIISKIEKAIKDYPYPNEYHSWPGPNSNTFLAWIARQVPEMQLELPANAIGKDYLAFPHFFAYAPSGTGIQFSIYGILGFILAKKEGLEINILGLVYGINPFTLTLKLPGFGDIKPKL